MDDLKALSTLALVVETGSFRRAAVELGVAPQATSKTVRQLEAQLGVRLLHRTTRRLNLTDEGERLLAQVRPALSTIRDAMAQSRVSRAELGGMLRITAPRSLGQHLVLPLIASFVEQHPEVQVELELEDRISDTVADKIDVGFRTGGGMDRNVVARRLLDIQHWICASPQYLERHGRPRQWADLARHRCTGFRHVNTGKLMPWEYGENGETTYRDVPASFTTNDVDAEVHAVVAGLGIGQLPSYIAAPLIREGRLVQVLARHTSERIGLYLYYPQRAHLATRARRFIDFAVAQLRPPR
ncbi:LysR substrate-binding domain-containing protein [Caldimonas sp. KR1-144]|uniref:LysR family transcriptional regulator n=1 Tax=Caldimonas sp. KR1-144 TaxID=3400911 RepID=UPI003BFF79B8